MISSDGNTEDEMIRKFRSDFESKKKECAVLIVRATSDPDKWTIAGFSDAGEFQTAVIDDPSHELSEELKKEPMNKDKIAELATSSVGRTRQAGPSAQSCRTLYIRMRGQALGPLDACDLDRALGEAAVWILGLSEPFSMAMHYFAAGDSEMLISLGGQVHRMQNSDEELAATVFAEALYRVLESNYSWDDCLAMFDRGIKLAPEKWLIRVMAGVTLLQAARMTEDAPRRAERIRNAKVRFREVLEIDPASHEARLGLAGALLVESGTWSQAAQEQLSLALASERDRQGALMMAAAVRRGDRLVKDREVLLWLEDTLHTAINEGPYTIAAYDALAELLLDHAKHNLAESFSRRAIQHARHSARSYNNLGLAHHFQNRFSDAIAAFDKAVGQDPNEPRYLINRAESREQSGDYEGAISDLLQALGHQDEPRWTFLNLAVLSMATNQDALAEEYYARAKESGIDDAFVLAARGAGLTRIGRYLEAIEALERALEDSDVRSESVHHAELAWTKMSLGRHKDAGDDCRAIRDTAETYRELADAHTCFGDIAHWNDAQHESASQYEKALKLRTDDPWPYANIGWTLLESAREDDSHEPLERALELFDRAIDYGAERADAYWFWIGRADALRRLGRVADEPYLEAQQRAEAAISVNARKPDAWSAACWVSLFLEDVEKSVTTCSKAAEDFPDEWDIHRMHGLALARAGRLGDAVTAFTDAKEMEDRYTGVLVDWNRDVETWMADLLLSKNPITDEVLRNLH